MVEGHNDKSKMSEEKGKNKSPSESPTSANRLLQGSFDASQHV